MDKREKRTHNRTSWPVTFYTENIMASETLPPDTNMTEDDSKALSSSPKSSKNMNKERGKWSGRLDFFMSLISNCVGLGNIWRFPYLCYRNGGGVFLIPYIFFMVLCGMPLMFLEFSFGQFASLSPITVWKISPLFRGIGYGMAIVSGVVCIYYNVIIAWTIFYLIHSFFPVLPWSNCDNAWNTDQCTLRTQVNQTNASLEALEMNTHSPMLYQETFNLSLENNSTLKHVTPSEEFWNHRVLQISSGIEEMGGVSWELLGCLALSWIIVFLILIKGIKSFGKVMHFIAIFPYPVLIVLLVRGITLPGSLEGIKFYILPQWEKLATLQIWGEAAMQILYSLCACWGSLITMASYNKFHNDCYRDARIMPLVNSGTSIFGGFVIFSIIGFMAHLTGSDIDKVVAAGPGLVFVVYPEAVANLPVSQIWAVMFFSMLFSVAIGTQVGMFKTLSSSLEDKFQLLRKHYNILSASLCFLGFLLGIPCVTNGGIYYLQIMDWYSSTFSLMILGLTECMVIAWAYGLERFYSDIEMMLGYRPCIWWKIMWGFVTPLLISFILVFSIVSHTPVTYDDYSYPGWAIGIGWVFALCSIIPLPLAACTTIVKGKGSFIERFKDTSNLLQIGVRPQRQLIANICQYVVVRVKSESISNSKTCV